MSDTTRRQRGCMDLLWGCHMGHYNGSNNRDVKLSPLLPGGSTCGDNGGKGIAVLQPAKALSRLMACDGTSPRRSMGKDDMLLCCMEV